MDQSQRNPVLRRKLGPRAPAIAPAEASEARLLARALARATSRIPGLVGSCGEPARRSASVPELLDLVDSESFVALIADPSGATGLAVFDPVCTVSLIEALTIGRLSRNPPPGRRSTQTDALLLSEVIDTALAEYDRHGSAIPGHRAGFRFQRFPPDYRVLELALEASHFDLVVQPLALLGDELRRDGQFLLALPQDERSGGEAAHAAPPGRRAPFTGRGDGWTQALEAQVMAAPAQLTAVLGRVRMPLSEVMTLGVGSQMVLPLAQLEEVEVQALDGRVLGRGRLGQYRAMRALRLLDLGPADDRAGQGFETCATAVHPTAGETAAAERELRLLADATPKVLRGN